MTHTDLLSPAFRALSARLGQDPLQVQGPGGNTSVKGDGVMWIKASGTELAEAETKEIFVAVDLAAARAEAEGAGDGTCKAAVLDPSVTLRPSIETTFHAVLDWPVVMHTHSVATLTHAISSQGGAAAADRLAGLPVAFVPYRKPGLPLTREILTHIGPDTRVIVLQNHGLICCGETVEDTGEVIATVEARLALPPADLSGPVPGDAPEGRRWVPSATRLGTDPRLFRLVRAGSYYPDHVVFLGPALPVTDPDDGRPAILVEGQGVLMREDATAAQRAMLDCLVAVLSRLPEDWRPDPIGPEAEAELLNWDAEKYRMALARGG